jgi:uncharacterized SAM-binding protein YcdF (DUF218 family)
MAALAWPLWHAGTALIVTREIDDPDAIIMLASHEWERLPAAAALARRYPRAIVLLTVPRLATVYNCHRCADRVDWLEEEGVDSERVRLMNTTQSSTYGEALAARTHAWREPFARLLVVTSPYHTRRALATFRTVFEGTGVEIGVIPAAPAAGRPGLWWLHRYDRWYVRYEWAAMVVYRLRHGVAFAAGRADIVHAGTVPEQGSRRTSSLLPHGWGAASRCM